MSQVLIVRRFGLYGLAFALALLSNYLFTGDWVTRTADMWPEEWTSRQTVATVCLICAIACAAWSFGSRDHFPQTQLDSSAASPRGIWDGSRWKFFAPCAVFYLTAALIYLIRGENSTVRWLWLLSIISLIIPLLRNWRSWGFSSLPFWEYVLLMIIVAGAFIARYADLADLPYHVDNDVSIMGLFSQSLITNNDWHWVGMAYTNHQYSEHQFYALSMRLFGADHYGLVMLSVLSGTATVAALHFLGKILFNRWVGLIAASFLAFNYVHIHFSRIVFGPLTTFFTVLAAIFLLRGILRASYFGFAFGGICMGMALLGYYSGRVGPVIGLAVFALWIWQRKQYPAITASHWLLGIAGMLCTFGPNLIYAFHETDELHGRGKEVIIWTEHAWRHLSEQYRSHGNPAIVLEEQIKRTLLAPFYYPDSSTICYLRKPMLGAFTALSFILGIGYCLRRWKDVRYFYPIVWIALTFLLGGILTIDPPFWPHLNIAIPAIALVAGVGIERFSSRLIIALGKWGGIVIPIVVVAAILLSAIHDWEVYDRFARNHAGVRTHAMRQIERLTSDYRVFLISKEIKWVHETFQFFNSRVEGHDLSSEELFRKIPVINKPTAFLVFMDADPKAIPFLTKAFPWSSRRLYVDGWGSIAFTMFRIFPPDYVEHPQHLRPHEMMWQRQGWKYIWAALLGCMTLGWLLLRRDLSQLERRQTKL